MCCLCGADGNPVQTTAPPTAPAALATTTCTCLPALATAVRQDERRRQRVAAILQELRRASAENLEAPDNGRPGGVGTLAGLVR